MKQPRDYMTTIMFVCMIAGAIIGLVIGHPTMELPAFTGFNNEKLGTMFPILFVTVPAALCPGSIAWCPPALHLRPSPMRRIC